MERYEALDMEVIRFDAEDVVTTSSQTVSNKPKGEIHLPDV